MVSRGKRGIRHPVRWLLILAAVVAVTVYFWPKGDSSPSPSTEDHAATASAGTGRTTSPRVNNQSPPLTSAAAKPTHRPVTAPAASSRLKPRPTPPVLIYNKTPTTSPPKTGPDNVKPAPSGDHIQPSSNHADDAPLALAKPPADTGAPRKLLAIDPGNPLAIGLQLIHQGKLVEGRAALNRLLADARLSAAQADRARREIAAANETLVFSDRIVPGDPLVEAYTIQSGDNLIRVGKKYRITSDFIARINAMADRNRIWAGQKIKVVKGPFHAVVNKSAFRLDLYLDTPDNQRMYIRSYRVGIGESNSTPEGLWRVRGGGVGKLLNPSWTNPRTSRFYRSDDPQNPIGEFWIGLEGVDENTRGLAGYGIHGTIAPDSIGKQASMGCVRMLASDIKQVYAILVERYSTVLIRRSEPSP